MGYSEQDGQVVLTMSREDYERLLIMLGAGTSCLSQAGELLGPNSKFTLERTLDFLNRLNDGNPNYTPYKVEEP